MAIKLRCQCGRDYSVADEFVGKRFRFKACGTTLLATEGTDVSSNDLASDSDFWSALDSPSQPPRDAQKADGRDRLAKQLLATAESGRETGRREIERAEPAGGEDPYLQVMMADGKVIDVDSPARLRELLLNGLITRQTRVRRIETKPRRGDIEGSDNVEETHQLRMSEWLKRREWTAIGEELAQEEFCIKVLYDPVGAYTDRAAEYGVMIAMTPVFLLTFFVVFFGWHMHITARPGEWGRQILGAIVVKVLVSGIIALIPATIAGLFGVAIGSAVGSRMGRLRKDSLPKPPDDGYQ